MSITEKAVDRFWQSMGQRYGSRWFDTYTDKPTQAWRECLKAFSPKDIGRAMQALELKESTRQHPPTEPEFRALLKHAARQNVKAPDDPNELRRGYWRSSIVTLVARGLGYDFTGLEFVLLQNQSLGRAMRDLLNDADELEVETGQRTTGIETMVEQRCREIVTAFNQLKAVRPAA
jgi:hypothetical protein